MPPIQCNSKDGPHPIYIHQNVGAILILCSADQWNGAHQWHVVDQSVENILSSFPRVVQLAQVETHLGGQLAKRSPGQSVVEFSV